MYGFKIFKFLSLQFLQIFVFFYFIKEKIINYLIV